VRVGGEREAPARTDREDGLGVELREGRVAQRGHDRPFEEIGGEASAAAVAEQPDAAIAGGDGTRRLKGHRSLPERDGPRPRAGGAAPYGPLERGARTTPERRRGSRRAPAWIRRRGPRSRW